MKKVEETPEGHSFRMDLFWLLVILSIASMNEPQEFSFRGILPNIIGVSAFAVLVWLLKTGWFWKNDANGAAE